MTRDRRTYIGGSSVATIMTGEQFGETSQDLCRWYQGEPRVVNFSGDMDRGNDMEPIIAAKLAADGWSVDSLQEHLSGHTAGLPPYIAGTIDGRCVPPGMRDGVLEIKSPSTFTMRHYIDHGVPDGYQWQCRLYMALCNLSVAYLVAWDLNEWNYRVWEIERDQELEAMMIQEINTFWGTVQGGGSWPGDRDTIAVPKIGGEAITGTIWHERLILEATELQASRKAADDRLREIKAELAMEWPEDARRIITDIGSAYWTIGRSSTKIDVRRLLHEHPDMEQYAVTTTGKPSLSIRGKK